jgi:hypothetical protein
LRPLSENPPSGGESTGYKEKLNNLAESFKNLSLEFDDEEDEDFD